MAKKIDEKDDEYVYDDSNQDYDSFDDFEDFDVEEPKDDRSPTTKVKDAVLSGVKDAATKPEFIKNFVRAALPDGYGDAIEFSSNIYGKSRSLYNEATQVIRPGMREFARATKTLLPKVEKYMPKALADKLKEMGEDENEYRARTKREEDQATIDESLNDIFETQMQQQAYVAERQSAEASLRESKEDKRHTGIITILQEIAGLENRAAGFRDNIVYKYQRKSLELQYRSFFVQRDTHTLLGESAKSTLEHLAAIAKNTGLPEYVKQNTTEEGRKYLRDKMIGKVGEKFTDWSGNFIDNLFKNIRENVLSTAQGVNDHLSGAANMIEQMRANEEMAKEMGQDPADMRRDMIGSMIGGTITDWLGTKIGNHVREYTDKNTNIVAGGQNLAYNIRNIPDLINEFAKSDTDYSKPGSGLLDLLKWNLPTYYGNNTEVDNSGVNKLAQSVPFDNQTHKSINEIIPGFLSRQLQSLEGIRTGKLGERLVYNHERQEFTSYGKLKDDVANKVLSQGALKYTDSSLQSVSDQIAGGEGKLSAKANKALKERLLKHSQDGGRFKPEDYAKDTFWGPEIEEEVKQELRTLFQQRYGIDFEGKVGSDSVSQTNRNKDDAAFQLLGRYLPNVGENVNKYANTGHRDVLRDLGLLYKDRTNDLVDSQYLLKRYAGVSGNNGANNGDGRSEGSGAGGRNGPLSDLAGGGLSGGNRDTSSTPPDQSVQKQGKRDERVVKEDGLGDRLKDSLDNNTSRLIEAIRLNSASSKVEETNKLVGEVLELLSKLKGNLGAGGPAPAPTPPGHRRSIGGALGWLTDSTLGLAGNAARLGWRGGVGAMGLGWKGAKLAGRGAAVAGRLAGDVIATPFRWTQDGYRALRDTAKDWGKQVVDLYEAGKSSPVLEAAKLQAGEYYDKASGKVLKAWKDIKSDVVDADGNITISYDDIRKGLMDRYGKRFQNSQLYKDYEQKRKEMKRYFGTKRTLLDSLYKSARIMDVYLRDRRDPVLTAVGFQNGDYLDFETRKVLEYVDDIAGPVCDHKGNQLLTAEQLKGGLFDAQGKRIYINAVGKFLRGLRSVFEFATKSFTKPASLLLSVPSATLNRLSVPWDVYTKTDLNTPKLLAKLIIAGKYRSKTTGKVISKYGDIDGPIVDVNGNEVLTLEDIKAGLVNRFGIRIESIPKKLASLTFGLARKVGSLAVDTFNSAWKFGKGVASKGLDFLGGVKNFLGGGFGALLGNGKEGEGVFGGQTRWLKKIYTLLDNRMPGKKRTKFDSDGDGIRDNSVADILRQRAAKVKNKLTKPSESKKSGDGESSWLGKMFGAVMGGILTLTTNLKKWLNPLEWFKKLGTSASTAGDVLDTATDVLGGKGKGGKLGKVGRGIAKGAKWLGEGLGKAGRAIGGSKLVRGGLQLARTALGLGGGAGEAAAVTAGRFAVGTAVRSAVVSAGTWLAGLTGAAAGVGAAPILLGAAAIAAVGYGAYKGYQYWKSRGGPLTELRMLQYGFSPDSDQASTLREMEDALDKYTKVSPKGEVELEADIDYIGLMKGFGVDPDNVDQARCWTGWFTQRFKPVYCRNLATLKSLDPKLTLERIDRMDDALKGNFALKVKDCGDAYSYTTSPFPNVAIAATAKDVDAKVSEIVKKFPTDTRRVIAKTSVIDGKGLYRPGAASAGGADKPLGIKLDSKNSTDLAYVSDSDLAKAKAKGTKYASGEFVWQAGQNRRIDDLASIRMRAYGLSELKVLDVNAVLALEADLLPKVEYSWFDNASMEVDSVKLFTKFASHFNCDVNNEQHRTVWMYWFVNRFTPVWLNFCSAIRKADKYATPENAYQVLKPNDALAVAKVMVDSVAKVNGDEVSVWSIAATPFPDQEANTNQSTVTGLMDALRAKQDSDKVKELNIDAKTGIAKPSSKSLNFGQYNAQNGLDTNNGSIGYASQSQAQVKYGGWMGKLFNTQTPAAGGSDDMSGGRAVNNTLTGTGGLAETLPLPKGDGWENVKDLLVAAAKMVGVDPALMATMASIESNFRTAVKAPVGSATGLFQFIRDTWKEMIAKYGAKYGLSANTPPTDPRANALMGAEYLKGNADYLQQKLGRAPNDNDLYLAHFLGRGGAAQLLSSPPSAIAAQLFPKPAANNRNIFYDKSGAPRTVAQVYQNIDQKVSTHGQSYGMAAKQLAATGSAPDVKGPTSADPGVDASDSSLATSNDMPAASVSADATVTPQSNTPAKPAKPAATAAASAPASAWGASNPVSDVTAPAAGTSAPDIVFRAPRGDTQNQTTATTTEANNASKAVLNQQIGKVQDATVNRAQNAVVQQQAVSEIQRSSASKEAGKGITDLKDVTDEQLKVSQSIDKTLSLMLDEIRGLRKGLSTGSSTDSSSQPNPTKTPVAPKRQQKEMPIEVGFRQ